MRLPIALTVFTLAAVLAFMSTDDASAQQPKPTTRLSGAELKAKPHADKALLLIAQSKWKEAYDEILAANDLSLGWVFMGEDSYSGGKIVIINTDEFANPKAGITRLRSAFDTLTREFASLREEVEGLQKKAEAMPAGKERKALEKELDNKRRDGQRRLDARVKELTGPIYQDIGNELSSFCKEKEISLVVDVSKPLGVPFAGAGLTNVTDDFVAEYNKKHP
ncbi:MAG TPA: OmpH family outer membrane protein [Pyrinomonadaceae bacterium]|nr:OmpH family outer membrane protein [Pyrinomonadaceae bacterium]